MNNICQNCKKNFERNIFRKFCSKACYGQSITGRKVDSGTKAKIASSLSGKPHSLERKQNIGKGRQKMLPLETVEAIKSFLDFGMPDGFIMNDLAISQKVFARYKTELFPNGIPWQIKYLESDIPLETVLEVVRLSKSGVRYRRISSIVNLDKKTVKRILTCLSVKDKSIRCLSYDDKCWSSRKESEPERVFSKLLEKHKVEHRREVQLEPNSKWFFDFHIIGTNHLVEINGDYWHCNPRVYSKPINEYQEWAVRRDFAKKQYAKRMGYETIVFWEHDLKWNLSNIDDYIRRVFI